jgi:hypothetical protein
MKNLKLNKLRLSNWSIKKFKILRVRKWLEILKLNFLDSNTRQYLNKNKVETNKISSSLVMTHLPEN